jgi:glycosyltransferase involved in cell wall biosynthesis
MKPESRPAVAYILKRYPRLSETFILNEIRAMERLGETLHIFSLLPPEPPPHHPWVAEVRARVHVPATGPLARARSLARAHRCALMASPSAYLHALRTAIGWIVAGSQPRSTLRQFVRAGAVADACRKHGIGHIHAHFANAPTAVAHLASLMSGIRFSFTAHAKDIYLSRPASIRRHLRAARFVVTCTGYNVRHLRSLAPQTDPRKIRLVYHGIDLEQFRLRASPPSAEGRKSPPLVLSVGRLVPKKGHEDVIRACALLRDRGIPFQCLIVGCGPLHGELSALIVRLELTDRVLLYGAMTHADLLGLYREADVFVLAPRIAEDGDRDGIPNVIAEAMAIGVPVVATEVSGIPELVRHGASGLLAPCRDPAAIAVAMQRLFDDRALGRRLAERARVRLEREFNVWETTCGLHSLIVASVNEAPRGLCEAGRSASDARQEAQALTGDSR